MQRASEGASEAQVVFSYGKEGSEVCVLGRLRTADDDDDDGRRGRADGRGRAIG